MSFQRLATELVLGPGRQVEARRAATAADALGEIEQQFQIGAHGEAGTVLAWANVTVVFDVEFVPARYQRYSNLAVPNFTFGYEALDAVPVLVTAVVLGWDTDDRDIITGATIGVGCVSPAVEFTTPFSGRVHMNFQGYGAVAEPSAGD